MSKKNICVIGSGPCGITTCQELLKYNYDVTLVDIDTNLEKIKNLYPHSHLQKKENISPKYNNNKFKLANMYFLKINNISKKNFFLSSVFSIGGLSNFWGGGIEFPHKKYFKNFYKDNEFYNFFLKEKKNYNVIKIKSDELLKTKKIELFNPFFLSSAGQIDQFRFMKFYLDNRYIYNAADQLKTILNKQNFTFFNNSIVKNIIKEKTSYKLVCINLNFEEVIITKKFDQIYICAGAIGSKLLVNRIINNNDLSFKLYHTPMLKIFFLQIPFFKKNINHMFKINHKINIGKGYMLHLNNVDYKSKNFLINLFIYFFKKFVVVGTFFYHPSVIDTFFSYSKKNNSYSINFNYKRRYRLFKNYINKILFNFCLSNYLLKIPFLSIKENTTGSDAHYTSTLYKSNFLNKNNEIVNFKNIFVNDTSVIKPGLFYPTFLSINYAKFMVKINNKK